MKIKSNNNGFGKRANKILTCDCCERRYRECNSYEGLCPQCDYATGLALCILDGNTDNVEADLENAIESYECARTSGGKNHLIDAAIAEVLRDAERLRQIIAAESKTA
jgi:hypothetical protein